VRHGPACRIRAVGPPGAPDRAARRAVVAAPDEETLDRLGDRSGALDAYEAFAKRLYCGARSRPLRRRRVRSPAPCASGVATLSSDAELPPVEAAAEPPRLASDSRHRLRWLGAATAVVGVAVVGRGRRPARRGSPHR